MPHAFDDKPKSQLGCEKNDDGTWTQSGDTLFDSGTVRTTPKGKEHEGEEKRAGFRDDLDEDTKNYLLPHINEVHPDEDLKLDELEDKQYTKYFNEQEAQKFNLGVAAGKLNDSSGKLIDTSKNTGFGTFNLSGVGKNIFAMGGDGQIRTLDPWANTELREVQYELPHWFRLLGDRDERGQTVTHGLNDEELDKRREGRARMEEAVQRMLDKGDKKKAQEIEDGFNSKWNQKETESEQSFFEHNKLVMDDKILPNAGPKDMERQFLEGSYSESSEQLESDEQ